MDLEAPVVQALTTATAVVAHVRCIPSGTVPGNCGLFNPGSSADGWLAAGPATLADLRR